MKRLALVLTLSACATGYQHAGLIGGYDDYKVSDNQYHVTFRGNGYTSDSGVEKYFLRRCAEITKNAGYDYFVFQEKFRDTAQQTQEISPARVQMSSTDGRNYSGTMSDSKTITIFRHRREGTILLLREGQQPNNALKAATILESTGEK